MNTDIEKSKRQTATDKEDAGFAFSRLCKIMAELRAENGCPWDAEQTPASLKPYILEEAYEVLEAIDSNNKGKICEELGDLLLQVVFQAQIYSEAGDFSAADVATAISEKLIRRHPHVFADAVTTSHAELHRQWDTIKMQEQQMNGESPSIFAGIPAAMPSLMRAQKIISRASRQGFDCKQAKETREALNDQLHNLDHAIAEDDHESIHHEIGEMLFAAVNLARSLDSDAELALHDAGKRFQDSFEKM